MSNYLIPYSNPSSLVNGLGCFGSSCFIFLFFLFLAVVLTTILDLCGGVECETGFYCNQNTCTGKFCLYFYFWILL